MPPSSEIVNCSKRAWLICRHVNATARAVAAERRQPDLDHLREIVRADSVRIRRFCLARVPHDPEFDELETVQIFELTDEAAVVAIVVDRRVLVTSGRRLRVECSGSVVSPFSRRSIVRRMCKGRMRLPGAVFSKITIGCARSSPEAECSYFRGAAKIARGCTRGVAGARPRRSRVAR
jgi:hypothetical protein